jgi:tetratricopeptide (TPR) repeat protein
MKHWHALIKNRNLAIGAGLILGVTIVGTGIIYFTRPIREAKAGNYLESALAEQKQNPSAAEADVHLALTISPRNPAITAWAAEVYLNLHKPLEAISQLRRLPLASGGGRLADVYLEQERFPEAEALLTKLLGLRSDPKWQAQLAIAFMEQGRGENALESLKTAYTGTPTPNIALHYAIIALATGHKDITSQITTSDASTSQQISSARANPIILGRFLYDLGMPKTAKNVLIATDQTSTEKFLLLARIEMGQGSPSKTELEQAAGFLKSGIELDPSDLGMRRALVEVYSLQHNEAGIKSEQGMIAQIEAGKP